MPVAVSPTPGCFDPQCHHPTAVGDPILPVTHLRPSQSHLGHPCCLSPWPGAQGSHGARGGTIALKIPAGLWGSCFFGMTPHSPPGPKGFPAGSPNPAAKLSLVLSLAGMRPRISPGLFLFQGDGGVSALRFIWKSPGGSCQTAPSSSHPRDGVGHRSRSVPCTGLTSQLLP